MMKHSHKIFDLVFCMSFLIATVTFAQPVPKWVGVNALMPQALYWSAVCSYNGKIYVFGGNADDAEKNTTFIYDPVTDVWTQGANMPTARYLSTAVEVGGKIYVMGGRQLIASANPVNKNECYDPATNTWSTKTAMPSAIRGHAACAANGKIYVLGGNTGSYTSAVNIYDPVSNGWSAGVAMPVIAGYGGAVYSSSTNSIFWLGGVKSNTSSASNYIGKVFAFSLASNSWDAGTSMVDKTAYFGCTANSDGSEIYITGGIFWEWDYEDLSYPFTQVFVTASKTWEDPCLYHPSPWKRDYSNAAFVNDTLFILGCEGNSLIESGDPSTGEFYEPNLPINDGISDVYISCGASAAINGKFYVVDGGFYAPLTGSVYVYDPPSNAWNKKNGSNPNPRMYVSGGKWNDKIVVYGGMLEDGSLSATAVAYDPLADSFTQFPNPNPGPTLFETGVVYNDKLYLFGGRTDPSNAESLTAATKILNLTTGTWSSGANLPKPMEMASAAAYNGKIYVFGGIDNLDSDYVNPTVYIYNPSTNSFTAGATQDVLKQAYGASAVTYGNYILVDSGYNLWYNDSLGALSGGMLGSIQVYNTVSNTFTSIIRPFGKMRHATVMIGDKYYSTAGEDPDWPVDRLDIANFSGCTLTCSAAATPNSGPAPLTVNFTGNSNQTGCTGTPAYSWNFGDGATSDQQNPSHVYASHGSYPWSMTVSLGTETCTRTGTIVVGSGGVVFQSRGAFTEMTGDGDSYFEPGEKWSVPITVFNDHETGLTDISAILSGNGVTVCNPTGSFGTIAAGGTGTYAYSFVIDDDFTPCGGNINFNLGSKACTELTPAGADETNLFSIQVGQIAAGVPTDLVLQPSTADSYVNQGSAGTNYGSGATMSVQSRLSQAQRTLVMFDLSAIPENSVINSATLELYASSAPTTGLTLNVHRITGTWTESGVTWTNQPAYNSTVDSSLAGGTAAGWKIWNIASVVQGWVDGTNVNYGLIVKGSVENDKTALTYAFSSKENGTSGNRPILRINYTPPTTMNCDYVGPGECDAILAECAPGDIYENGQTWSGTSQSWPALTGATGYKLYRGIQSGLPNLLTADNDSCLRYEGSTTSVDLSPDDPSSETGRLYWYIVTGTNGSGEGPSGNGRIVNSSGVCE